MAVKRAFDIAASGCGLLLTAPLLIVVAIAIKIDSAGPVFFRQERVGRHGRLFRMFKFRSMIVGAAAAGTALTVRDDRRITRLGAFLRRSKLDELPQLLNVLRGEMSIVGPRPEVAEFMRFYTPRQRAVIVSMRPGMTDYAAICFHDESLLLGPEGDPVEVYRQKIMPAKYALYERYSRDIGVLNDLRIIAATVLLLLTGRIPRFAGIAYQQAPTTLGAMGDTALQIEQRPSRLARATDAAAAAKAHRFGAPT